MQRKQSESLIHGTVAPGFEPVREVFIQNFTSRGELGAACAAYVGGEKVVDLWGGQRNHRTGEPWEKDTLVMVWSTTKGMSALALAVAHSRGLFEYDKPVATYWPEFAQNGKGAITVRQLFAHQAGLCAIDQPLDEKKLGDLDGLAALLAAQRPEWSAGKKHGYHAFSLGAYEGELIRRVDPRKRSLGRFFQDEVAKPLGLEFYIGLPAHIPESRMARMKGFHWTEMVFHLHTLPFGMVVSFFNPRSLTSRTLNNPRLSEPIKLDSPAYQAIEMPAATGVGQARAIARAYGVFATGGTELNIKPETLEALHTPAVTPAAGPRDAVLHMDTSYALGFAKPSSGLPFGSSNRAFGMGGAGGSFGFADPDLSLGFAYVMNRMGLYIVNDPREKALRDVTSRCAKEKLNIKRGL